MDGKFKQKKEWKLQANYSSFIYKADLLKNC